MIHYDFGMNCVIDWNEFLQLKTFSGEIMYKSNFTDFPQLYEYIDKNKKDISNLLFDGHKYILENGMLHNLFGPVKMKYNDNTTYLSVSRRYFINGKPVWCNNGPCKVTDFEKGDLYFHEEITNRKSTRDVTTGIWYRRKEGIDYKKYYINLEELKFQDKRNKKLKRILK